MELNRRGVLKKFAVSGVGLAAIGGTGTGVVAGQQCSISCDGDTYVKYELVERDDGTCYFEEETDTGIFSDSLTITATKDGDSCEPLAVSWDESEYVVTNMTANGATDCDDVSAPDGSYSADQPGEDGLETPSGTTAAISNLQFCVERITPPECPSGTNALARYEATDSDLTFQSGDDVVTFSNVVTDSDGIKGFDFTSTDSETDVNTASEVLTTVTVRYGPNVTTFEVDPDFDVDKRSGTVDLTDAEHAIDDVLFCQAVYAQADFVKGDVIDSFCNSDGENIANYGSDKISSITWSSYNGQLDGVQGQFDGRWIIGADTVTVDYNATPISNSDYDGKVSLAVYQVDDPVFRDNTNIDYGATKCRQTLVDSDTDESSAESGQLVADLPSTS